MSCRTYRFMILATVVIALVWTSLVVANETVLANSDFEQGQPGQAPEHWRVPNVPGCHVFVSDENPKSGKQCVTIKRDTEGPIANVVQKIDAAPFRGKRVRYRAAVRTDIDGQNGRAQLWMRVDLPPKKGQRNIGFFDNMSNRPIRKKDWDYYEIVGDVAEDAETINLGMFLAGRGQAWMDDASLEIIDRDAEVTGRVLGTTDNMLFDGIGPGLLEIIGAMELKHEPSLANRIAEMLDFTAKRANGEQEQSVNILLPLPLAYWRQAPVTYELTVDPPEAATGVTVYQDTPHNHVAKFSVVLGSKRDKVDIKFRSLVLVAPSSFSEIPDRAEIPDQWPEQCRPWLRSTWCVNSQHDSIRALSRDIRDNTEDADDVLTLIAGIKERAGAVFANAQGQSMHLTAVEALTNRGSCTSNANLVAALLRASNIPARVVAGYPSWWPGPLQTHYIVEAYVPGFGWYPIESTLCKSPWPNEYQVNVAIIPPEYESRELADARPQAAGGVPFLSLTETPNAPSGIIVRGTLDPARSCGHQCRMVRKFPTGDARWDSVFDAAGSRWQKWLASKPQLTKEGQLILGPKHDAIDATSPSELMEELINYH